MLIVTATMHCLKFSMSRENLWSLLPNTGYVETGISFIEFCHILQSSFKSLPGCMHIVVQKDAV